MFINIPFHEILLLFSFYNSFILAKYFPIKISQNSFIVLNNVILKAIYILRILSKNII